MKLSCLPHRVLASSFSLVAELFFTPRSTAGIIEGIVVDPQGAVVPDVQPYWAHNTILLQFCALPYLSRLGLGITSLRKRGRR
jgi:hypothetical protein